MVGAGVVSVRVGGGAVVGEGVTDAMDDGMLIADALASVGAEGGSMAGAVAQAASRETTNTRLNRMPQTKEPAARGHPARRERLLSKV